MQTLVQRSLEFPDDHAANLARVGNKTRSHIIHFTALHAQFHINELVDYVRSQGVSVAPASCDRILRLLRQAGELNYRVLNRRQSLYETLPVGRST